MSNPADTVASGDRGASVLELALVTPILAMLVLGILDLTQCYHMQIRLENAAREGGAYAQLRPGNVTCADDDIIDRVVDEDDGMSALPGFAVHVLREDAAGEPTVPVTGCGQTTIQPGEHVRVEAIARYPIVTPFVQRVLGTHVDLAGSYEVVVQG